MQERPGISSPVVLFFNPFSGRLFSALLRNFWVVPLLLSKMDQDPLLELGRCGNLKKTGGRFVRAGEFLVYTPGREDLCP